MKKIILIGAGGHCKSCIDVIEGTNQFKIVGLIDGKFKKNHKLLKYKILGGDNDIKNIIRKLNVKNVYIAIGGIKNMKLREKIFNELKKIGLKFPIIISSKAYVSKYSKIGEGTMIMNSSIINSNSVIGKNCIINNNALIEHDVEIGDHSHISTSTTINGNVKIGKRSFVGSGSIIRESLNLKNDCFIKMGSILKK